jgi:uncharacterized protein YbjT (DUF2867 family)
MNKILVTGATGYIGGRLVARLLENGREIRCLARDKEYLQGKAWVERVEVVQGDVLEPATLPAALEGIDTAYYLIHSMGASARGFEDRDRRAALNFAQAAREAEVRHIVYLGGLGNEGEMSSHLESRQETGRSLASTGIPTTEFRAAIIVGSGSLSFEMIRYLTERLPVMITPKWVGTRVQPIAVRDVLSYLEHAIERPPKGHKVVEIGGPDVFSYREMMFGYAAARGLTRTMIPVPVLSPRLSSYWVNLITPIPASIARPLIRGLGSEVVVRDPEPARAYPVAPIPYAAALKLALDRTSQGAVETLWSAPLSAVPRGTPPGVKLQDTEGMLVEKRSLQTDAEPEAVYRVVLGIGGARGYFTFNWAWRLRGLLDLLWGGVGMRRGRRDPDTLLPGDSVDFWRVESLAENRHLQLRAEMKVPGRAWLRFDLRPCDGGGSEVVQTAFFEPKGLFGFLYWWALYPVHLFLFSAMIRAIVTRAEALEARAEREDRLKTGSARG